MNARSCQHPVCLRHRFSRLPTELQAFIHHNSQVPFFGHLLYMYHLNGVNMLAVTMTKVQRLAFLRIKRQ